MRICAQDNSTHPGGSRLQLFQSHARTSLFRLLFVLGLLLAVFLIWGRLVLDLVGLIFGSATFAFLLLPLCRFLEKKLSRSLSAIASLVLSGGVLLGLISLLLPALSRQISSLSTLVPEAFERIGALWDGLSASLQNRLPGLQLPELQFSTPQNGITDFAINAVNYLGNITEKIYRLTLMVVLSYFLLNEREKIQLRLELLAPASIRTLCIRAGNALSRELRLYLRGQMTIALAVGALSGILLTLIGIPGAALMGIFVGIFNVIPYFGPILGGVPAMIMALSVSWQKALFCLASLFLVQQIDGLVISPRVMGNITGFSPAVVLLALFIGGRMGSILGMLLALPALMVIRTIYRIYVQRHEKN